MHRSLLPALVAALACAAPAGAVSTEVFAPDGLISRVDLPAPPATHLSTAQRDTLAGAEVTPLQVSGPSANRLDLVILGDGYTAAQQELFHEHALAKWQAIKRTAPFDEYASYFNVWMVDVVSNEAGVDNDPYPGTLKDTALDGQFWCNGTERLVCADQTKASAAAAAAPGADQVLVLVNSTKYGGAGGGIATSSGGNAAASLITVHELGHSLGGLADEYDYYYRAGLAEDSTQDVTIPAPYTVYVGAAQGEPSGPNITAASTPEALVAGQLKWWRWVGAPSPDGGTVGTFEGAGYYRKGMYRPSTDSLMHTLGTAEGGNPYNPPSAEEMVDHFYRKLKPVDGTSTKAAVDGGRTLTVRTLVPATHGLDVHWAVDGTPVPEADGQATLTLSAAQLASATTVVATVVDNTPLVRNPDYRAKDLTQKVTFTL